MSSFELSIGDLVARTGVAEPTLRMWERRHGFPQPQRTPSGHRRYSEAQAREVGEVLAGRRAGLSLAAAIERARSRAHNERPSLHAALRRLAPVLEPRLLGKPVLIALSHAIEDEMLARAERQLLFGCFQRQRFYRSAQARWRELALGAAGAAVFADFAHPATPPAAPAEIPITADHPLAREWTLVCYGERSAICLAARETAGSDPLAPASRRHFEAVWTVDPVIVRELASLCVELCEPLAPQLTRSAAGLLEARPAGSAGEQLELATAVMNRTLAALS